VQLLLTDRLTCPRCGPPFGLILLAQRLDDRRVLEGSLGCPNCRDTMSIRAGFADLRAPPRGPLDAGLLGREATDASGRATPRSWTVADPDAERLRAQLGLVRGPGTVALVGGPARTAASLASAVPDVQVVAVDAGLVGWPDAPGVSRVVCGPGLPFFSGTLRGVAVDGRLGARWLEEAGRVVAPRAHVVVVGPPQPALGILEAGGLRIVASDAGTVVAARG
jgi:hypothetical protein